jgi:uncharacterized protein involved in tolerance to divalent cations
MTKRDYCYLYLTCKDATEASKIAHALLEKRLVVCAKQIPVDAAFWWKAKITQGSEVLLIMESALDLFDTVEQMVSEIHSYETFVLEAVPIAAVSQKAQKWMEEKLV